MSDFDETPQQPDVQPEFLDLKNYSAPKDFFEKNTCMCLVFNASRSPNVNEIALSLLLPLSATSLCESGLFTLP